MREAEKHLCKSCQDVCDVAEDVTVTGCKQYKRKSITQFDRLMADMTVEKMASFSLMDLDHLFCEYLRGEQCKKEPRYCYECRIEYLNSEVSDEAG